MRASKLASSLFGARLRSKPFSRPFSLSANCNDPDLSKYKAVNEPVLDYAKNSPERTHLERKLNEFLANASKIQNDHREALFEVPIVIGDKEV